ncbi:hypothetical protein DA100_11425 [Vibrio sp. Hep-1b-8]|nr:hypothetical protein DA100_11425 [Vibrio sp. Hep-1b-8]
MIILQKITNEKIRQSGVFSPHLTTGLENLWKTLDERVMTLALANKERGTSKLPDQRTCR